jgi:NAD(P)-dependent dehydrogenase (short-subunit alcohol dehydrogenase family)
MKFSGKIAVVTGAASGIGMAVAIELAKRGVSAVACVDRSDQVIEVARQINAQSDRPVAEAMVGDATDAGFRKHVFDQMTARHGTPTICVPAAGITRDQISVKVDPETGKAVIYPIENFHLVLEVNLVAPIYWAMEMISRIAEQRRRHGLKRWEPVEGVQGTVVFIGSVSSQGNVGQVSYATTKAGLDGAQATLSLEAIYHGVRCAIIHPGYTNTPMVRALGEDYINKKVLPFSLLRRLIEPDEIADAICFLISNSAVSGQLWADAGWHPPA